MDNKPESQKSWMRWLVLLVISLVMFGSYYVYDCVSPINDYIQKSMSISNSQCSPLHALAMQYSSQGFLLTDFLV
jgi:hypothetical protein